MVGMGEQWELCCFFKQERGMDNLFICFPQKMCCFSALQFSMPSIECSVLQHSTEFACRARRQDFCKNWQKNTKTPDFTTQNNMVSRSSHLNGCTQRTTNATHEPPACFPFIAFTLHWLLSKWAFCDSMWRAMGKWIRMAIAIP